MNARLARLALRRSLAGWPWLLALAVVAASASWAPDEALRRLLLDVDRELLPRALARRGVWTSLLLLAVPWAVWRAAAAVPRWRQGEIAWLASAPVTRAGVVASTALGQACAAAVVLACIALAGEAAAARAASASPFARSAPAALRPIGTLDLGAAVLEGPGRALSLEIEPPRRAAFLRVPLIAVGGGNATRVRLVLARGGDRSSVEVPVAGRAEIRAPIPAGLGPVSIALERTADGPLVAVASGGAELLERVGDERLAGAALAARALAALVAWQALAFGLGAWMRTELAAGLALALALLACAFPGTPLAGVGLPRALDLAGQGLVPERLGGATLSVSALAVLAGLALARAGLRDWRGA